jgi:hypothetical protein
LAAHCTNGRGLIVGDLSVQRKAVCLEHVGMKPCFARLQPGQQLEVEPPYQRALQQDLLLAPQILDIEWRFGAASEA